MKSKLVILGGGESGTGAAVLAKLKGFDVLVSDISDISDKYKKILDENNIDWEEKKHSPALILEADEVIKSPGIPDSAVIVQEVMRNKINIVSEIEFASRYTKAKKVCITGSNGKTTTTMLVYHILKNAGLNVGLAGNVGQSFAMQVAKNNYDYFVIELSSFYNQDDEAIVSKFEKINFEANKIPFSIYNNLGYGGEIKENSMSVNLGTNSFEMNIYDLAIQGKHNLYNSMAATISAKILDIKNPVIRE
ncbi:MAG: UDP-N-acetylmuramoylalanine--D-glutamate ligase, partial [Bacteroidetes bacterium 4572_117]